MDQKVLDTQKWLNNTYGNVSGYDKVTEDGLTGWNTIYSLREGLQHELGLTEIGSGFGDATMNAVKQIVGDLVPGYKGNIAQLIQGAFWCKGISPVTFNNEFTTDTKNAFIELQEDAGLSGTGVVTADLMKALFDMSAFVLVPGGDSHIRNMQQTLNRDYNQYFGILPCDGVYQRDTNTALIYALQAEEGMGVGTANGVYGPGTVSATPTLNEGDSGNYVRILQWGLYTNGFNQNAEFDGSFNSYIADEVLAFRKFMVLTPYSSTANLAVIKGLLTSNGDTNRDSIACDTATQLSLSQIKSLKGIGFSKIGRYLTGTVGVGEDERDKNLTIDEINNLVSEGFSIFPLYEDGGYEEDYFTASQGTTDGYIAGDAAESLGFAEGTVIYFAVDVDFQDGDIDGTVIPYIKNVKEALSTYGFKTGIYGTRNVCLHAQDNGINYFFVSNMSTGWSGNLGFKMPENWCFDQFIEYTYAGIGIDQVAASGKDEGCSEFNAVAGENLQDTIQDLIKANPLFSPLRNIEFKLNQKIGPIKVPGLDLWVKTSEGWSDTTNKDLPFSITNGQIDSTFHSIVTDMYQNTYGVINYINVLSSVNRSAKKIKNGEITFSAAFEEEEPGQAGIKIDFKTTVKENDTNSTKTTITFEVFFRQVPDDSPYPELDYKNVWDTYESIAEATAVTQIPQLPIIAMTVQVLSSNPKLFDAAEVSSFILIVVQIFEEFAPVFIAV